MHASIQVLVKLFFLSGCLMVVAITSTIVHPEFELSGPTSPPLEEFVVLFNRMRAKDFVIDQMLAGRLNLFEAAARFQEINETPEKYPDRTLINLRGRSKSEKVCRQVILWYRARVARDTDSYQCGVLVKSLERQLETHIAGNGAVILP